MPKCVECKYCFERDYGYSNYTVEGRDIDCLLNANPDFPVDAYYNSEPILQEEIDCDMFAQGSSNVYIDVDEEYFRYGDWKSITDPDVLRAMKARWGRRMRDDE